MLLPLSFKSLLMNSMGYLSEHMYTLWWKMAWSVHNVDPKYVLFLFRLYPLISEVSDSFKGGWRTICMGDLKKNHNRWKEGKSLVSWQEFKSFLVYFYLFFLNLKAEGRHPKPACAWGRTFWSHCCRLAWRGMLDVLFTTCSGSAPDTKLLFASFLPPSTLTENPMPTLRNFLKKVPVKNWWFSIKNYLIGRFPLTGNHNSLSPQPLFQSAAVVATVTETTVVVMTHVWF